MPKGDPRDRFFSPTLTLMIDSYSLGKPRDAKWRSSGQIFYPTLTLIIDSYIIVSFFFYYRYFQHGSYPVINPYNETFPGKFYTKRTSLHQMVIRNNDDPSIYPMSVPRPGTWYISAFIPKSTKDKEIKPPVSKVLIVTTDLALGTVLF